MKNNSFRVQTSHATFEIFLADKLELDKKIPAIKEIYQITGDLPCKIISDERLKSFFGNFKLETIFQDIYQNKFRLTINQEMKFVKE